MKLREQDRKLSSGQSGNRKDTNPKDAVGTAKVPFSTVPARVIAETGLALLEGARKYGRHNYRSAGVRASVYYDAALRHLTAWYEGQDTDPDSGLPHVVKAIACLTVLRDSQIQGNWVDDRPPATPGDWVAELNFKAKALLEKYPDPLPAHTELARGGEVKLVCEGLPSTVDGLNEEWMREFEWRAEWSAGRNVTYAWRKDAWHYFDETLSRWEWSNENGRPGENGPFKLIEP